MRSEVAIAVIGIGCRYPGAQGVRELWENILARRQQFRQIPDVRLSLADYYDPDGAAPDKTYGRRAAVIDGFAFDWTVHRVPKLTYETADIAHWLALDVALQTLADSGYSRERIPNQRAGVIVGNTLTGEQTRAATLRTRWPFVRKALRAAAKARGMMDKIGELESVMETTYQSVFAPVTEDSLVGGLSNTIAGRICNTLDFHGGGYTVDGACASSLLAVATAANALVNHDMDFVLAGGVDVSLDTFELIGFAKTGALTPDDMRVYDRRANGFIPGEGCGFVALKRLDDARADGDHIYAALRGWGISSDGRGGLTSPSQSAQAEALRRAYSRAGYSARSVAFFEGHGTGTSVGDRAELEGILLALGEPELEADSRAIGISSFKSIVGHTKAAAGIGGFIKAVLAVNQRIVPPTAGCSEPNPIFERPACALYPVLLGDIRDPAASLRAGVSAMGFGGVNCHVTLESGDPPAPQFAPSLDERALLVSNQDSEVFVFSAPSVQDLINRVEQVAALAAGMSVAEMVDLAAQLARETAPFPVRAALIAHTPEDLLTNLESLTYQLRHEPPSSGQVTADPAQMIWIGQDVRQDRLGFLFPGQGSQYLNMARTLIERFAWARELVASADTWLAELGLEPVSPLIFVPLDRAADQEQVNRWQGTLTATQIAQPAICLASLLWLTYLNRLGITPVVVGGHSLGELTAFHAANAFDAQTLIRLAAQRGHLMAAPAERAGTLLSLACSAETAVGLLPSDAVIANINSPRQTVVSGSQDSIEVIAARARVAGIQTRRLPVSNAFHSPFVAQTADYLRDHAPVSKTLGALSIPLISGIDGHQIATGIDLPGYFAAQVVRPVNFVALTQTLIQHCDLIAEVGPGRALSGLVKDTTGLDCCLPVGTSSARDLNRLLARLFVQGGAIHWDVLYEARLIRPFVPAAQRRFIENPCERPLGLSASERTPTATILAEALHDSAADIPQHILTEYLARRSPFIMDIIQADLRHAPSPVQAPGSPARNAADPTAIETHLIDLIARRTGYPIKAIMPGSRLLDDLNLDSIKAGELIATLSHTYGVVGKLEPTSLTTASVEAIASAVRRAMSQPDGATLPTAEATASWVRNFVTEYVPAPLKPVPSVNGHEARLFILHEPGDSGIAEALRRAFGESSATCLLYNQAASYRDQASHVIALLSEEGCLEGQVKRLHTAACMPSVERLTFVQFGGGFFGARPTEASPDFYNAVAFAKSIYLERPTIKVRVLDFSPGIAPALLAERLLAELALPEPWVVAGYDAQLTRRVSVQRVQETTAYPRRALTWSDQDVILVTGGGKGITAECALALAQHTRVRMALVGSSPEPAPGDPPDEMARTLARFKAAGLVARYYSCDITDPEAVLALVEHVRQTLGPITGVIHGAALNQPQRVEQVSSTAALQEIAPKVRGALNLCRALQDTPPRLFIALASIIGVTGMAGNAWYAFSNEALDPILRRFEQDHPESAALSIAFSLWAEVGMGARLSSVRRLSALGVGAIAPTEGARRFVHLFEFDPGARQVIVTARLGNLDTWRSALCADLPQANRYLEDLLFLEPSVEVIVRTDLTLERDDYIKDHRFRDSYLFPAVFGLEAMAQAVACVTGESHFETLRIEAVQLEKPIVVTAEKGARIEIRAEVLEPDTIGAARRVRSSIRTEQTGFLKDHFAAIFVLEASSTTPNSAVEFPPDPLALDPKTDLYGGLLFQGPQFQRLQKIYALDSTHCLFSAEAHADNGSFILGDPYFRDSLLQAAQLTISQDICLPISIERIELHRLDEAGLHRGAAFFDGARNHQVFGHVFALDPEGHVIENLTGLRLQILEHHDEHPTPEQIADPGQRHRQPATPTPMIDPQMFALSSSQTGPDGQTVLALRFPVTFKETAHASRTLYFSHYFDWMGTLREIACQPVTAALTDQFATGAWGMVTNEAETQVFGAATAKDSIEGRLWIDKVYGPARSTLDLCYEWRRLANGSAGERIGTSRLTTTWVTIRDTGTVEVQPFPPYFQAYIDSLAPRTHAVGAPDAPRLSPALGSPVQDTPGRLLLSEKIFETSSEDSNLVGNIYFANYAVWQGRVVDQFLHRMAPGYLNSAGKGGDWQCVYSRTTHLREAMPFDQIAVRMYLTAFYENGIQLSFDYFRVGADGGYEKLASGEHHAVWMVHPWKPTPLPSIFRDAILNHS